MNRFAELLDAVLFTPSRNGKLRLMSEYFASVADPERGWALAVRPASWPSPRPSPARCALAMARDDPVLFAWSLDFVGDLAETVSLIRPEAPQPLLKLVTGVRPRRDRRRRGAGLGEVLSKSS